ncbi:hypothetical protein HW132_28850 [Brasilonema sp. CT11]|nr:hypothetical protein [Brasilonema sp. CT11]
MYSFLVKFDGKVLKKIFQSKYSEWLEKDVFFKNFGFSGSTQVYVCDYMPRIGETIMFPMHSIFPAEIQYSMHNHIRMKVIDIIHSPKFTATLFAPKSTSDARKAREISTTIEVLPYWID